MTCRTAFAVLLKLMLLASVFAVVGGVASFKAAAQTIQSSSTVAGCITDTAGRPLPGVTVDVGKNGDHRIVLSNSSGCYAVTDVPSGSYFVFARLEGFISVTRDNLNVHSGRPETVNFRMDVAPICECLSFPATLGGLWDGADTVVRVRITGHANTLDVKHITKVLRVWKQNPDISATDTLTFVQLTERNEIEPYAVGQEFIIFLRWSSIEKAFVRWSNGDGNVAAFAIENGRVRSAPIASYTGMDEEQLVQELSSLSAR